MSIKKITAQITFFRFCYSDPTSAKNENVSINFINNIINDYISFTRLKITYINDLERLDKKHAILLTNTIMVLQSLFPQGANINCELIDVNTLTIRANNPTGKINAETLGDFQSRSSDKIKNIQVRYLNELAGIYRIKYEVISVDDNETSIKFCNAN